MSSGKYHDLSIAVGTAVIIPLGVHYLPGNDAYWLIGSFVAGGVWLSPDVDLRQSKPSQRWLMFSGLWEPYRSLSGHRGFSHVPVIGTLSRMIYLALLLFLPVYWMISSGTIAQSDLPEVNWLCVFYGLELSTLVHLFMDYVLILK